MSKHVFNIKYLVTNIALYLNFEDILSLNSCNKTLKTILNPLYNRVINIIYYNKTTKKIFEMDEDDYFDDGYNKINRNNLLEDSWKSKMNWRLFLSETLKKFQTYPEEKIKKNVLNSFKLHMYLPDLRKDNSQLEYEYSSINQIYF